jgi:hypothetical protein|tara:strand:+ start:439 stop:1119 length:681 start_codon:yes stop_codon:yes gene_type:complete
MNALSIALLSALLGQVNVLAEQEFTYKEHRAIELSADIQIEEGFEIAKIQWRTRATKTDLRPHDKGSTCSVWAPPGKYEITLDAWMINWESKKFDSVERIFNITVEGSRPPPDNPDVKTSGKVTAIIISEASKQTGNQSDALLEIRTFVDENQDDVSQITLDPDAENPDGSKNEVVKEYVKRIPLGSKLPFVFLTQLDDSDRVVVKWLGELETGSDLINRIKEMVN